MGGSCPGSRYTNMDKGLLIGLLVAIGIPFCLVSGLTAFLITYQGYLRSEKQDKKLAFRMALQTALVILAVFVALTAALGFVLARIIAQ
jgi:4-hydroxybenzoate polyprenyltransferase